MLVWVGDIGVAAAIQFALGVCGTGSSFFCCCEAEAKVPCKTREWKDFAKAEFEVHFAVPSLLRLETTRFHQNSCRCLCYFEVFRAKH